MRRRTFASICLLPVLNLSCLLLATPAAVAQTYKVIDLAFFPATIAAPRSALTKQRENWVKANRLSPPFAKLTYPAIRPGQDRRHSDINSAGRGFLLQPFCPQEQ